MEREKVLEIQTSKKRIAVAVERSTLYGRNILRGFAEIAGTHPEWDLSLIDPRRTSAVAARGGNFDAWICRIPDDRAATALARTGRPIVDLATPHDQFAFASVATDAKAIGRLAAEHLLTRRYPAFAFCGYPGIGFSDRRRDAFAAALAQDGFTPAEYRPPRLEEVRTLHLTPVLPYTGADGRSRYCCAVRYGDHILVELLGALPADDSAAERKENKK